MMRGVRVKMLKQTVVLMFLVCSLGRTQEAEHHVSSERQTPQRFEKAITKVVWAHYLLYLPSEYRKDPVRKWPLILFLHVSGERGADLELVKRHGIPKLIEEGREFEFIAVSPQCPEGEDWSRETLNALLEEVIAKYSVDEDCISATGLSMGGWAVWNWAIAYPDRFAAIAPVCGRVDRNNPGKACRIKHVPTWVFHGAKIRSFPSQNRRAWSRLSNDAEGPSDSLST